MCRIILIMKYLYMEYIVHSQSLTFSNNVFSKLISKMTCIYETYKYSMLAHIYLILLLYSRCHYILLIIIIQFLIIYYYHIYIYTYIYIYKLFSDTFNLSYYINFL